MYRIFKDFLKTRSQRSRRTPLIRLVGKPFKFTRATLLNHCNFNIDVTKSVSCGNEVRIQNLLQII